MESEKMPIIRFSDIPDGKTVDDYPEDTLFVLDDRPKKFDPRTGKFVWPDDPGYDDLPFIDYNNCGKNKQD